MISETTILRHIGLQAKQSAGYKQLVHELGVRGGSERRALAETLQRMVKRGALVEAQADRFSLPGAAASFSSAAASSSSRQQQTTKHSAKNLIAGRLRVHPDGFGFVTPDDEKLRERISGDIFIPPPGLLSAMHGDRVLVEARPARADGRVEGRIVSVAERQHATVVGIFHYGPRQNTVTPIDEKITQPIVIPRGAEVPRATHEEKTPHRVLGKEVRRQQAVDLEEQVVDVEITEWPTATQGARGRVIEILGSEEDFGVDVEIMIRKHHIPHRFPPQALREAQDITNVIHAKELERRRDFRGLPIVTIDGETARDFDDAVTVRRLEGGNYELQVHIADVAHYVMPGSALDEEALLRGTSVYFPDRAVPMLPLELSTDICSLRTKLERLVLSCVMEIDHQGEVVRYELSEGVIESRERMTYTDVNLLLEGDAALRERYAPLAETFALMRELAMHLNRQRVRRGSIDFDLPEPVIEFDEQGLMQGVSRSERNIAHRIIEEFMLAANECVAGHLEQRVASIYRIHEKPEARKIYDFESIAASFGYSLGIGALPIQRAQMKSDKRARYGTGRSARAVEIPQEVHITPRMYQKLTQKIAGKPEERILSFLMLRSLKQARYSEKNEGHFALAATSYTHFTSPIRRYPDLLVHRILKEVLGSQFSVHSKSTAEESGAASPWSKRREKPASEESLPGPIAIEELHEMAELCSLSERRAQEAERELLDWKKMKFMQQRLGQEFAGLIISVTKFGMFVELEEMFIEGLVPLASLEGDRFTYRENTRQIIGERTRKTYSLGNRVRVLVDRIDRMQRKIQFAVVEEVVPRKRR